MSANHIKGQIKSDSLSLTLGNNSATAGKLTITSDATNADKTLTLVLSASSSLSLAKNLTITTGNVTLAGNAGGSSVVLPASGTLSTLAGSETLTNKTLTSPVISGGSISGVTFGLPDADVSHNLSLVWNEDDSANRTLNLLVGGASRSLSLLKDLTVQTGDVTLTGNAAGSSVTLPASGTMARTEGTLAQFATTTSLELKTLISDETGSGALVFATSPTLVTPNLGTPSSLTLTNATGLPVSTGISGLGTNVAAFLADPTSANLAAAVTNETGTGNLVFSSNPTLTTPTINGGSVLGATVKLPAFSGVGLLNLFWDEISATNYDLTLKVHSASRTLDLTGNLTLANNFTTTGSAITLQASGGAANLTLPTTGTLATLAGSETLSNKTLVTPDLGVAVATSINKVTLTAPATSATLTIADGKTLTASNTLTLTGTDGSSVAFGGGGTVAYTANKLSAFAATTSAELAGVVSDETGSGSLVFATSPTLTTPNVGAATGTSLTASSSTLSLATVANGNLSLTAHGSGNVTLSSTTGKVTADRPVEVSGTSSYVKFPSLTTAQRDALSSPAAGMTIFNTDVSKLQNYSGSSWTSVGGGGTGGINYLADAASELSDASVGSWAQYDEGASATPVDGTGDAGGSGDNQLSAPAVDATTKLRGTNSLKLVKAAANAQGEGYSCAYTSHEIDKNTLQEITFNFDCSNANYTAGDVVVYIYDVTNAALITPSQTSIPAGKGTFKALFVNGNSNSYRLILHYAGTNSSAQTLYFDNFMVGPVREGNIGGVPTQEWTSYTPTLKGRTNGSTFTNQTTTGKWRRVGDTMEIQIKTTFSGAPGTGTGSFVWTLPNSLNIDTTKLASNSSGNAFSTGNIISVYCVNHDADSTRFGGYASYDSTAGTTGFVVLFTKDTGTSSDHLSATHPGTFANGDAVYLATSFPIAEWAGETVSMANSRVEYVYNTSTSTTASDTSSFGYGPSGAQIQNITAALDRRVRFQTPIQESDVITVQVKPSGSTIWMDVSSIPTDGSGNAWFVPWQYQNGAVYGLGILQQVSSTDMDVGFGQYVMPTGLYGAAGQAWSVGSPAAGAGYWRVVKSSNPLGIGTGLATSTTPGAYAAGMAPGATNGAAIAAGYVGEVITSSLTSLTSVGTSNQYFDAISITLTAGVFLITGFIGYVRNGATVTDNSAVAGISVTSGNSSLGGNPPVSWFDSGNGCYSASFTRIPAVLPPVVVRYNGTTLTLPDGSTMTPSGGILYLKGFAMTYTGGPVQYYATLTATRIA